MPRLVTVKIDGIEIRVPSGTSVAAALALAGKQITHRSVTGQQRGPFCGIGVCLACRVTINGQPGCRSCKVSCQEGMEVITDG
ncbi:MAG: (2Fe-2S)-binding protein [Sedimentisphaerales bacterium]|jgi:sarcosine oxidase subunit alpha|nr:(2Fe-2S)-binding protein [Sedimentisphaerales bacterium]